MPDDEIQDYYQNAFGTPQGRKVLGHILKEGHFGVPLDATDSAMIAEYNFALYIARMARALDPIYPQLGIPTEE